MNIVVNTRLLLKGRMEGIGWFTYETLKRVTRAHPEHQFIFVFDREFDPEFVFAENVTPVIAAPQARHPFLYVLWFELSIPRILKKHKADLFLSPDGYLSIRAKVPSLAVIHDLNFEHYPEHLPWLTGKYYRHFFPRFARKATRIATVSEFSKSDIVKSYQIAAEKIDVVYDGANASFRPLNAEEILQTRSQYTKGMPYFIFVGALHARKNISNLFRAFDLFIKKSDDKNFILLFVGAKKWWTSEIRHAFESMNHKDQVVFAGRLDDYQLNLAMGAAIATMYVSYFEGFGIPIIESFRCGTPVITSNVTSMPEVAGDAALLCDPANPDAISDAMTQIVTDEKLRETLISKGFERQKLFSWDRTAERLWNVIMKMQG